MKNDWMFFVGIKEMNTYLDFIRPIVANGFDGVYCIFSPYLDFFFEVQFGGIFKFMRKQNFDLK